MIIAKNFTFESAHMIVGHPHCGRVHGHTWTLTVFLEDNVLNKDGMILDFSILGGIVKTLTNKLDHRMINEVIAEDEFYLKRGLPVTAETLVMWFVKNIEKDLEVFEGGKHMPLAIGARLQEGPGGWAEYWNGEVMG